MVLKVLLFTILQTLIDPAPAVENLSLNYGLLGTLLVISLALLVGAMIYIRQDFKKQVSYLNMRLDKAENETETARRERLEISEKYMNYVQTKNDFFAQIIKEYAETRDKSSAVIERLLAKL